MSHPDYTRPSGQYPNECVPGPTDFQDYDVKRYHLVDGDAGGLWTPTSPVIVGGAGWALNSASTFTGGAATSLGGRLVQGNAGNGFPIVNPDRVRTTSMPLLASPSTGGQVTDNVVAFTSVPTLFEVSGIQTNQNSLSIPIPAKYLHNGAFFISASLNFRMVSIPTVLPLQLGLAFEILGFTASTGVVLGSAGNARGIVSSITWATGTSYPLNTYIKPTNANTNGFYYVASAVAGTHTSGATDPVLLSGSGGWPKTVGSTAIDNPGANQITWTNAGNIGQIAPSSVPAYYNNQNPQSVSLTIDNTYNFAPTIDTTLNSYSLVLLNAADTSATNPAANMILHSLSLKFLYKTLSFE